MRMKTSCLYTSLVALLFFGTESFGQSNYVRAIDVQSPQTDASLLSSKPLKDVRQSWQYFDGVGRSLQTVSKNGSLRTGATAVDFVLPSVYDFYGRQLTDYLPYASSGTDGSYKSGSIAAQNTFYNNADPAVNPIAGQGESSFFAKTDFEYSPLSRKLKTYAPGVNFVGANRGISISYWLNTAVDDVKFWTVADNLTADQFSTYTSPTSYAVGQLQKTITTDEGGNQIIEFKDKDGLVVLKKVQLSAAADDGTGSAHTGWLCTYYIYDNQNRLSAVVQPAGVEWLRQNAWSLSNTTILDQQTFRYEYDAKNRMIMKQVPGALAVYMVYDKWDRLVMTQDGRQRPLKEWLFSKYDSLNRPVMQGIYNHGTVIGQDAMQALLNTQNLGRFEIFVASTTQPQYSTSQTFPNVAKSTIIKATYYDHYTWAANLNAAFKTKDDSWDTELGSQAASFYPESLTQSLNTLGKVTGVYDNTNTYTSMLYNDKGRVIQTMSRNITGGVDVSTSIYSFNGQTIVSVLKQENSRNPQTHEVWTKNTFDDLWRMTKIEKRLKSTLVNANVLSGWSTISDMTFDALGQLKTKNLGTKTGGGALSKNEYNYNIRGWLLQLNKKYLNNSDATDRYFGFELGYDKAGLKNYGSTLFNGNIAGTYWKSGGDQVDRQYNFTYDKVNRLARGDYSDAKSFDYSVRGDNATNGDISYDYNGNILKMSQRGWTVSGGNSTLIDDMTYGYAVNDNRLTNMSDGVGVNTYNTGDFQPRGTGTSDYTYDSNGNLITDDNKRITSITYNFLNLPLVITVNNDAGALKGTITYSYTVDGAKLSKTVVEKNVTTNYLGTNYAGDITTITTYLPGAVYESKDYQNTSLISLDYSDKLLFLTHEEGRIRLEAASTATCTALPLRFLYDYFIKDHLGSTRAVLTEQKEDICYIPATLETATLAAEKKLYDIQDAQIKDKSVVNGAATYPQLGSKLYQTIGSTSSTAKTGLAIVLKVMAGDVIKIKVQALYTPPAGGNYGASPVTIGLTELLSPFVAGAALAGKGLTQPLAESFNPASTFNTFNSSRTETTTRPKAYLNYLFFDEQFKYAGQGAVAPVNGFTAGSTTPVFTDIQNFITSPLTAAKNGYIYIYVSNESNIAVFFDNLNVTHTPGAILEETHYYPFGLTMSAISSKSAATSTNKLKFGGKELNSREFNDNSGLELYDFSARNYDPQIGRWLSNDPLADKEPSLSPFRYGFNNPVRFFDANGAYETDGHFWTVYLMAKLMGRNDAFQIAQNAEAPDNIMNEDGDVMSSPSTWLNPSAQWNVHALNGGLSSYSRLIGSYQVLNASTYTQLGNALHYLGDSFAHSRMEDEARMYPNGYGHLFKWHKPDKIALRPDLYRKYVNSLYSTLSGKFGYKGQLDAYTFDYVAKGGGTTEDNSAVFETEIRIRDGKHAFYVDGDQVENVGNYIQDRNKHYGTTTRVKSFSSMVGHYKKNANGEFSYQVEEKTFITLE